MGSSVAAKVLSAGGVDSGGRARAGGTGVCRDSLCPPRSFAVNLKLP